MTETASQVRTSGRGVRSLRDELRARARRRRVPLRLQLEVTARCNLRCAHCYVADHQRAETPLPRLLELVREVAALGCFSVSLTGGEIGLRRDWLRVATEVRRQRMLLTVLTSGTAFSAGDLRRLVQLRPSSVAVSLYGSTAAAHDAVTRVAGSFDRSLATLRALRAAGVRCRVSSLLMRQTIDDFRGIAALAESLGCSFMFDPNVAPCDDGSTGVLDYRVDIERLTEFYLDDIIRPRSLEGRLAEAPEPPDAAGRDPRNCESGLTLVAINASGEVYPCMGFPPAFGNINRAPFATIWHGAAAEAHRAAMAAPLHDCPECDMLPYCTFRCARLAAVEDGDLTGPSARACEMAQLTIQLRETFRGDRSVSSAITTER